MKLIASNIFHFKWKFSHIDLNPRYTNKKTLVKVKILFNLLETNYTNLSKYDDTKTQILYFPAPKGRYEDDEEYKYSLEFDEKDIAESIKQNWDIDYPNQITWFSLMFQHTYYNNINYYSFFIDNRQILSVSDEKYDPHENLVSFFVNPVVKIVNKHIKLNTNGEYQKLFNETFGYGKRKGTIEYKKLWEIYPSLKNEYLANLKDIDLERLFSNADNDEITYFSRLTSSKYFDICKIGYLGVDPTIDKNIDSKELFYKKADGRTWDLENINPNSEDEFDDWYEKNSGHFDHCFEIFPGHSFYRGDFSIQKTIKVII